jgi:TPR repeat protein
LAIAAKRAAVAGDAAAQWLVGSLYIYGLSMPRDFAAGTKWIQTAAETATPAIRAAVAPGAGLSETELFAIMLNVSEALPELVRRKGAAPGIIWFDEQLRAVFQALGVCPGGGH